MRDVLPVLGRWYAARAPFGLATVVEVSRSAPRGPGAGCRRRWASGSSAGSPRASRSGCRSRRRTRSRAVRPTRAVPRTWRTRRTWRVHPAGGAPRPAAHRRAAGRRARRRGPRGRRRGGRAGRADTQAAANLEERCVSVARRGSRPVPPPIVGRRSVRAHLLAAPGPLPPKRSGPARRHTLTSAAAARGAPPRRAGRR